MFYFLNDSIQTNNSGIEHAQIKRLNLFKQYQVPAQIVTRQYDNNMHDTTRKLGIDDQDILNLFDYFQEVTQIEDRKVYIQDLHLDPSWKREADGFNYYFSVNKQRVAYVRRYSENDKRVMNIQYFDHFGKLLKVRWFDCRGFASVEQIYGWDDKISVENYLRPDGSIAIQKSRLNDRLNRNIENYHLFNFQGQDYQFTSFDQLTTFFYDQIVANRQATEDKQIALIVDRANELAWSVLHMNQHVFRAIQLHNNHANDANDMLHSSLNYNYEYALKNINQWDAVICLTTQQTDDFNERFAQTGIQVYQIPGPIVPQAQLKKPHVAFEKRTPYKVVVVARLAPEKQQKYLIEAWPQVIKALPAADLDLWGYEMGETGDELRQQVKELGVTKSVHFKGYTSDVNTIYDQTQLLVLPSRAEGLPLTLVEAQSHGVPIVANDIKYGPADVVIDHVDGILTQNEDVDGLANAIIELLSDQKQLANYSAHAYEDSQRFSEANVMKKWQTLIDDVK
jgi:poly(glycerol-phosphate) alpha-glucosyltransferase